MLARLVVDQKIRLVSTQIVGSETYFGNMMTMIVQRIIFYNATGDRSKALEGKEQSIQQSYRNHTRHAKKRKTTPNMLGQRGGI